MELHMVGKAGGREGWREGWRTRNSLGDDFLCV